MIKITCSIEKNKMKLYDDLIKRHNGRYLNNPFESFNSYQLNFCFDNSNDFNIFNKSRMMIPNNIIEKVKSNNIFERIINHIKYHIRTQVT